MNVFPSEVEFQLLQVAELAPHYQIVVDRPGAQDRLTVQVEPAEAMVRTWGGFDPDGEPVRELQARVKRHLGSALGLQVEVAIVPPRTLPRSEGKAVRVVDRRQVMA